MWEHQFTINWKNIKEGNSTVVSEIVEVSNYTYHDFLIFLNEKLKE